MNQSGIPSVPMPLVRFNNWVTLVLLVLSWVTQQAWIVAIPLITCGLGAAIGWNPVIALAKQFFNRPSSSYVSEEKAQLRFNQLLCSIMLAVALVSSLAGWAAGFYIFTIMPAAANIGALSGFCVGCFIRYRWLQYRHARNKV